MLMDMRLIIDLLENKTIDNWTSDKSRLLRYAAFEHGNCYADDELGGGDPASFDWSFDPNFSVNRCIDGMTPADRAAWMKNEILGGDDEENAREYNWTQMIGEEIQEPIVVVIIGNNAYCWDGNHRIGACCLGGVPTLPAVVGRPRVT